MTSYYLHLPFDVSTVYGDDLFYLGESGGQINAIFQMHTWREEPTYLDVKSTDYEKKIDEDREWEIEDPAVIDVWVNECVVKTVKKEDLQHIGSFSGNMQRQEDWEKNPGFKFAFDPEAEDNDSDPFEEDDPDKDKDGFYKL
jgi:hypothetical protein